MCVFVFVCDLTRIFSALSEKTDSQDGLLPSSQAGSSNCKIEDSEKTNILSIYNGRHDSSYLCVFQTIISMYNSLLFQRKHVCDVKQI